MVKHGNLKKPTRIYMRKRQRHGNSEHGLHWLASLSVVAGYIGKTLTIRRESLSAISEANQGAPRLTATAIAPAKLDLERQSVFGLYRK